ncbi:PBSX family phage terminase large subunit [Hymenobacter sediminis]|uniref:PBSX family phage terminase large subunit n=1 Tax=Hymenobacter sediminis TaxID=2218621 RepID=UPI00138FF63F|nr:terminase large subunit [Hymenobacter sediminis]
MFKSSRLFADNYHSSADTVVNQGGTSSGKTYSILQVLFTKLSELRRKVCTVAGQDIPNLKAGALRDALDIYNNSDELKSLIKSYNKSERIFEFHNGCVMEFKSYEDAQDAKSGKRDFLFVNEAQGVVKPIYDELELRTKEQVFIDYNPNAEFYVHDDIIGCSGVELLISDHRHNPFLMEKQRAKIEGLKQKDEELWKVYARGLTGKIEGLVLRNWTICEEVPPLAKFIGRGMDFGFTNDPTTAIDVYLQNGELWLDEVLYQEGLTNPAIHKRLLEEDPAATLKRLVADSAEPKSIEELRQLGFRLIEGAIKGPDSVSNGLDILKRYHLNVTRRSVNLRKELSNYKYRVDRVSGKPTNEPVDAFNHCIDPVRYVALNCIGKPVAAPITVSQSFGPSRSRR